MKRLLLFSAVVLFATVVRGQTAGQSAQITPGEFQAQVQRELSQIPAGAELYRLCDAFSRKIDYLASRAIELRSKAASTFQVQKNSDTALEGDISRSPVDEDEPSIAINRRESRLILAGANDRTMDSLSMPAYLTTDAGLSWKTYRLPKVNDRGAGPWGDPMIISDNSGTFYYAFLLIDLNQPRGISDLMVAHSTDGKAWTLGRPVVGNTSSSTGMEDKETIAIDNDLRSPHYGRLYIAWTEYEYSDTAYSYTETHLLAYSDNKGATWSKPIEYTQNYGYFALLRVGEFGTVVIASMSNFDSTVGAHGLSISTDGGNSFTDVPIASFTNFPLNMNNRDGLKGDNGFRATPYPCFDLDTANKIYAVYGTYDENNGDAALYETTSTDLGQSWSNSVQIGTPEGLGNDHYMAWVNVDPITQQVYISMSSSEEDMVLNVKSRAVLCNYQTPNQLLDMGSHLFNTLEVNASGDDFLGDYAGSDAYNGFYAASWTENRPVNNHDGEIFAYVSAPLSAYSVGAVRQINGSEFDAGNVSPNPASGNSVSVTISSSEERNASIRVFDLKGNEVLSSNAEVLPSDANPLTLDIHSLPAGVYHVLITSGVDVISRNLVILR
ncbi:MAG: T9SS type A sorting domain-containing protein [Candidatus Kapaibacterium sp.]